MSQTQLRGCEDCGSAIRTGAARDQAASIAAAQPPPSGIETIPALEALDPGAGTQSLGTAPLQLVAGRRLGGRYELVERVGRGGSGLVWRARHTTIAREFAIKVLVPKPGGRLEEGAAAQLLREARLISQLDHPNVVDMIDFGFVEPGRPYAVMELLSGRPLRAELQGEPLPWDAVRAWSLQILDGLAAAHDAGIVHRDLTPNNLFIDSKKEAIKLIDFGLAGHGESNDDREPAVTKPSQVFGTPGYMSPEQIRGETSDARSDLYSFGCVLYEMLTGRPPFSGTLNEVLYGHLEGRLEEPEPGPDVPAAVTTLVMRCLAKDPDSRPESAHAVRTALVQAYPAPRGRRTWWRWASLAATLAMGTALAGGEPVAFEPATLHLPSIRATAVAEPELRAELATLEVAVRRAAPERWTTMPEPPRSVRVSAPRRPPLSTEPAAIAIPLPPPSEPADMSDVANATEPPESEFRRFEHVGELKNPFSTDALGGLPNSTQPHATQSLPAPDYTPPERPRAPRQ